MSADSAFIFSFGMVFVRCSAMLMTAPLFGNQNTPVQIRIFTTLAIAGALTMVVQPNLGQPPGDLYGLGACALQELVAGLLLGLFVSLAMQAAQMAGAIMDSQLGLSLSQVLNPINGVPVTILSQFKYMLAVVVLLSANGHHTMLQAFAQSYSYLPTLSTATLANVTSGLTSMLTGISLLAVQIAAPVLGVSLVIDAALGLISRAVPQMQVFLVGMPAKSALGLLALGLTLPALVGAVSSGVNLAIQNYGGFFR